MPGSGIDCPHFFTYQFMALHYESVTSTSETKGQKCRAGDEI